MQEKELPKDLCADGKSYYQGGKFYPDPTPLEIPLGYQIPETLESMIARMVHNEVLYKNPDVDNVDEADDFDVMDEDPVAVSGHEFTEMQEEIYLKEKREALAHADKRLKERDTLDTGHPSGGGPSPTPGPTPKDAPEKASAQ